jgi:cytochrome c oxidase subunit I+III
MSRPGPEPPARTADDRTRRDLLDPPQREERPDHELPPAVDQNASELERVWADPEGFYGWFTHVNHKSIGRRYIVTAFVFFGLAGVLAAIMRLQLSRPNNPLIGPDLYNQIFTMHGTTMMFLFAVPVMEAIGIYFVPLMVGARSIAFPRLNAYSYWIYLFGGIFLFTMFLLNTGPDVGWFAYVPLAGPEYTPGKRADVWAQLITFTEVAALAVSIEIIVTAFKMRAPGMSLNRVPIFVWAQVVTAFMVLFAMPSVMVGSTCLILDRLVGTHFFNQAEGGDPLLWQHLFWFFGHPEVYIIFIPATGMLSTILTTFSKRHMFGYLAVVLALVTTAFMGFGLWVHHMFTTPVPQLGANFFTGASIIIAVPTGIQIFCWIATMWGGRVWLKSPMLWALGFFAVFIIGGLTGVMLAAVPLDWQVHDTFFVVAHFHYVLIGGAVFPLFGAIYYWYPKIVGRLMSERLAMWHFGLFFVGFNMTFFPMHQLGLHGMPRRIYTYPPETGWGLLNLIASLGAVLMAAGVLVFVYNALFSRSRGERAGDNPWDAGTLEWATTSPPPNCNFVYPPTVAGREPLWDNPPGQPVVVGLRSDVRDVLITHVLDGTPDHRSEFPEPTIWPFLTAVATTGLFIGSIFTPWAVVYGAVPLFITLTGWFWPKEAGETGTQAWPITQRTLPKAGEAPGEAA